MFGELHREWDTQCFIYLLMCYVLPILKRVEYVLAIICSNLSFFVIYFTICFLSICRYQLIRVHSTSLGERCKWLDMFEDTDIVLFCVSLTDYDEYSVDCNGVSTNKMLASKQLFESIVNHPTFENKNFLLILNKFDLLEEKIEQVPLTRCEWFRDFKPIVSQNRHNSTNPSLAHRAFHYIGKKFKALFHDLTVRKLFVSLVTGLEIDAVDEALRYAREIIMWEEKENNEPYLNNELSSTDIEASTYS
jgi:hypothetical protein